MNITYLPDLISEYITMKSPSCSSFKRTKSPRRQWLELTVNQGRRSLADIVQVSSPRTQPVAAWPRAPPQRGTCRPASPPWQHPVSGSGRDMVLANRAWWCRCRLGEIRRSGTTWGKGRVNLRMQCSLSRNSHVMLLSATPPP